MIAGIGVDTATVERIEKSIARDNFYTRVYGAQERAALDALSPLRRAQSAAGAWAAKEALGKALGTGLSGFVWTEAQVLHNADGAYGATYPNVYPDRLFLELGMTPDWEKVRYYRLLDELF